MLHSLYDLTFSFTFAQLCKHALTIKSIQILFFFFILAVTSVAIILMAQYLLHGAPPNFAICISLLFFFVFYFFLLLYFLIYNLQILYLYLINVFQYHGSSLLGNRLTGPIPKEIGNITTLQSLWVFYYPIIDIIHFLFPTFEFLLFIITYYYWI